MNGNNYAMPGIGSGYGMPQMNPYLGAYAQAPFVSQPMMFGGAPQPQMANALTEEEIKQIINKPTATIDLNVSQDEYLRSMCTHKYNGEDTVVLTNDGDTVFCKICGESWNSNQATKEEVAELVDHLISHIQNMKWVGNMPIELMREFCAIIPILRKFPDLYEVAINNFAKFGNAKNFIDANEASIYSKFDRLMGNPVATGYYGGYYGVNPMMPTYGTPMQQQMTAQPMVANPSINPMQVQQTAQPQVINPYGQPAVGVQQPQQVNPYMPQQAGFVNVPQQTTMPMAPQPYTPVFSPIQQPQQAATQGTEQKSADGTTAVKQDTVSI